MADKRLPTGRIQRLARIGRAAASTSVKQAATSTANVARGEDRAIEAMERRQLETAKQMVRVLGGMKGAAMKVGQVLSFVDLGLVPSRYREEFQRELGKLRDAAPTVSFEQMEEVIVEELGGKLSDHFAELDPEPIAAASIGQVYRAELTDGRPVAVKVQYPGVADAVRADMKNLGMMLRLAKRITPQLDVKAVGDEIRARIVDELDYELEASNHRMLARIYRGHPFIVIPGVVTELSRERVIVTDFVDGEGFEQLKQAPQEDRDRLGEIVFRFYFGSLYRHGRFSGDPHPGNMLRLADGRVAFFDFGLFKTLDREAVELELGCQRAVIEDRPDDLHALLAKARFLPQPERVDPEALMAYVADSIWWYTTADEEVGLDERIVTKVAIQASDPRSTHFRMARHQDIRPEHLIGRRMELLTLAVLGQLRARANWHRIAREWVYADPPVTELGEQEAEFYGAARRA